MRGKKKVSQVPAVEKQPQNKLKTLIGVDNQGGYINREQSNLDTVNCNNDEINDTSNGMIKTLQDSFERFRKLTGINIKVKGTSKPVEQIGTPKGKGGRDRESKKN